VADLLGLMLLLQSRNLVQSTAKVHQAQLFLGSKIYFFDPWNPWSPATAGLSKAEPATVYLYYSWGFNIGYSAIAGYDSVVDYSVVPL